MVIAVIAATWPATDAELNYVYGVAVDGTGNIYISDQGNNVIRKVNAAGSISTIAGNHTLGAGYSGDGGPATNAQFNSPEGIVVDRSVTFTYRTRITMLSVR